MSARRLLICDDEEGFGRFVARVARQLDFDVRVTTRGTDFMRCFAEFGPDTVVVDMVMPEMDGRALVIWLAERGYTSDVIMISGYDPGHALIEGLRARCSGLRSLITLRKPIDIDDLRRALAEKDPACRQRTGALRAGAGAP
jgi:DNA-binding response OmpR family regulator